MKYVIYKSFGTFKVTNIENFNARYRDARLVIPLQECYNIQDAKNTCYQYLYLTDDKIIIDNSCKM
jgi:hypothetical protein